MVQNSPKVTKKVLVFRKVARSCSLTKKLPSRIWKGLGRGIVHVYEKYFILAIKIIFLNLGPVYMEWGTPV